MAKAKTYRRGDPAESTETRFARVESALESVEEKVDNIDQKLSNFLASLKDVVHGITNQAQELHMLKCHRERSDEQRACRKELNETFVKKSDYHTDKLVSAKTASPAKEDSFMDYKKIVVAILLALASIITAASNLVVDKQGSNRSAATSVTEPRTPTPVK